MPLPSDHASRVITHHADGMLRAHLCAPADFVLSKHFRWKSAAAILADLVKNPPELDQYLSSALAPGFYMTAVPRLVGTVAQLYPCAQGFARISPFLVQF